MLSKLLSDGVKRWIGALSALVYLSISVWMMSSTTTHAEVHNETSERYGSFFHFSQAPNILFLLDEIKPGDSFELRRAIRKNDIELLVTSSPGGAVFEALQISAIVHDNKISTYIPVGGDCASACSFVFFAGIDRVAKGALGVHQFYDGSLIDDPEISADDATVVSQFTTSEIIGFLNEYGTPPFVYERMFSTVEMYYFNEIEKSKVSRGISNDKVSALIALSENKISSYKEHQSIEVIQQVPQIVDPKPKQETLSDRDLVMLLQIELARIGCNAGRPDGVLGPQTRSAIERFAQTAGLSINDNMANLPQLLEVASTKSKDFCPKPKTSTQATLSGNWQTDAICGSERFVGRIQLTESASSGSSVEYRADYWILDLRFSGTLRQRGRSLSFNLRLVSGNYQGSTAISGSGDTGRDLRPKLLFLRTADGCNISALRR